ncbi:MAG: DAK2 domain-containing protein, partial [Candidatus Limnocylindrales bacterium]
PLPDGDTGSNMMATLRSALEEAKQLGAGERNVGRVAAAVSFGALMGARGNSGVILSQIFRGMSEALAGKKRFDGLDLANALLRGRDTAYAAVAKPVEGTILTVIREASASAVLAAERERDMESVLRTTVESAARAVARTPSLLAILREAGVVDSGAEGLHQLLQGALLHLVGGVADTPPGEPVAAPRRATVAAHADEAFGYETMFLVSAGERPLDLDAVRRQLEAIGDSVLVAGDARTMKIHVHNERPDEVLAVGFSLGALSRISVENLDQQAQGVREARAVAFTDATSTTLARVAPVEPLAGARAPDAGTMAARDHKSRLSVIAVAAGDGIVGLFESFGVAGIVRGRDAADPSTGELLRAIRATPGGEVLVLPNNANVKLAAQQAAALAPEKRVVVVPTRNGAEGLAALLALDPDKDAAANAGPMLDAARAIQTLEVTEAVRAAKIGGRKVRKGQTIALDPDDGLVAVGGDRQATVVDAVAALDPGFELLTIYYGDGADRDEAESLVRALNVAHPGVEVQLVPGGQPHYRFLIAAE